MRENTGAKAWLRLWLGAILVAVPAAAGNITGIVRGPDGLPRAGASLTAYDALVGNPSATVQSAADGSYSIPSLLPASYFVHVAPPSPNLERLTGELYSGIRSNAFCWGRGTEVVVGGGPVEGIDFALGVGASISGTVLPLPGGPLSVARSVVAYDLRGCVASSGLILNGAYEIRGLPPGRYHLVTRYGPPKVELLYPNVACVAGQCDLALGAPVSTGGTADFALAEGGAIAGTITAASGAALVAAEVSLWQGGQRLAVVLTDSAGAYRFDGLPIGNAYRVLASRAGEVSEVYPDAPCPAGGCNLATAGTGIDVPAGSAVLGRDIQLSAGHAIRGTLSLNGSPAVVEVFGATGFAGSTSALSTYAVADLPDGSYIVRARMASGVTEYYDNHPCPANQICLAPETVHVAGTDVGGIDFAFGAARRIRGTVRDAAGDPIGAVTVEVSAPDGTLMSTGQTLLDGSYATESEGLPPGTYFVRTRLPRRIHQYVDRVWPAGPCGAGCVPSSGAPITVTAAADTAGIDLVLPYSGLDFFTVTPCRLYDSRDGGGPTIATGVLRALRLEAACGIPGNAVAVSANVTVTAASASGTITLWGANLAAQPTAISLSVDAGRTRANNAVLGLSLEGVDNLVFRGNLGAGGRYHLILDVNGYFARSTPP